MFRNVPDPFVEGNFILFYKIHGLYTLTIVTTRTVEGVGGGVGSGLYIVYMV